MYNNNACTTTMHVQQQHPQQQQPASHTPHSPPPPFSLSQTNKHHPQQGPPLAANLRAALTHTPLQPFIPQTSFLSLISTGAQHAVGTKGSWLGVQGNWVWTLKDWIDRGFMNKFGRDLPLHKSMSPAATTTTTKTPQGVGEVLRAKAAMRCGGCGSKVGGTLLAKVLSSLPGVSDDGDKKKNVGNVLVGVGDDAAVVRAPPQGHVLVQTVDFMRAFVSDPFVFGAVVANHCLSVRVVGYEHVGCPVVMDARDARSHNGPVLSSCTFCFLLIPNNCMFQHHTH